MPVQSPPKPPAGNTPPVVEPEIDGGVIEDARRRQRRHRMGAALFVLLIIAGALILGSFGGGGNRDGGSRHGAGQPASPGARPGHAATGRPFPGAPASQPNAGGIAHDACLLAPPNRYLPPWSGCVTVRRADLTGKGRAYLVLLYSRLSHTHFNYPGAPASLRKEYMATRAVLRVIDPKGRSISTVLRGGPGAAALLGIANVGDGTGEKIFIQVNQVSSGSTAVAYSLYHHRLTSAGVDLGYGGDSGVQAGFSCLPHARVIQRVLLPLGNLLSAPWKETDTTLVWRGPRLVKIAQRTHTRHGPPPHSDISAGTGCFKDAAQSSSH